MKIGTESCSSHRHACVIKDNSRDIVVTIYADRGEPFNWSCLVEINRIVFTFFLKK